jgi:competence protein ComEC
MGGWVLALSAGAFWVGILLAGVPRRGTGALGAAALMAAGFLGIGGLALRGRTTSTAGDGDPEERAALAQTAVLLASFTLLGCGWAALREAQVRASPLTALSRLGGTVRIQGTLGTDPVAGALGWTATLQAELVFPERAGWPRGLAMGDSLWVEGHGSPPRLEAGDRIQADGALGRAHGSFGTYLRRRGYTATFAIDGLTTRGPPTNPLLRAAGGLRRALRASVARVFPSRPGGLLLGLALGDTSRLDPGVEEDFRATGLSHLTAVSGENVAMFLAPILGLATMLGLGRRWRLAVGLFAVAFFVLLTRAEPSVQRAAVMSGITLLGVFLGRPRSPPAIVGGAVLLLLGLNPTLVYAIGFQLSVAATAGMALLSSPLADRLSFLPKGLAMAAAATLGAQAGVTPLLLYHFGVVPTVTLPANLLAFPAVGVAMVLGLLAAAMGLLLRPLGLFLAALARVPLGYLIGLADRLARSPLPQVTAPGGQMGALLLGLGAVGVAAWLVRSGRRPPRPAIVAAGLVLPLFVWSGALRAGSPRYLTVRFFSVGQGDAALVRSPGGATILVDGGPDPEQVATKLGSLGIRRIDLMVATHRTPTMWPGSLRCWRGSRSR